MITAITVGHIFVVYYASQSNWEYIFWILHSFEKQHTHAVYFSGEGLFSGNLVADSDAQQSMYTYYVYVGI